MPSAKLAEWHQSPGIACHFKQTAHLRSRGGTEAHPFPFWHLRGFPAASAWRPFSRGSAIVLAGLEIEVLVLMEAYMAYRATGFARQTKAPLSSRFSKAATGNLSTGQRAAP